MLKGAGFRTLAMAGALAAVHCGPVNPTGVGGTSGTAGTGGSPGGTGGTGGARGPNTAPGFQNLAPAMGAPLDRTGTPLTPPPPVGWTWYQIPGAICRDGSPTGFYVRYTTSDRLVIYLEGGGVCSSPGFCGYNPANVNQVLAGDAQQAITTIGGAIAGRQQPGIFGFFETGNAANPFRDWNMVYVPYCTGDVHFGARPNATIPGLAQPQQFVGYSNMQKFIARIVPTFKNQVSRVILTGASAGSFGAGLNLSLVQDSFGDSALVDVLMDSGVPFADQYMPVCMQQRWRAAWGLNEALPPDCTECRRADGGGLLGLADFMMRKHPNTRLAAISSIEDEIMRLFFSVSNNNCATYETADPVGNFIFGIFPGPQYTAGLNDLRSRYASTGRFASYYLGGGNWLFHQHIFRPRFYDPFVSATGETIAQWVEGFVGGTVKQVGP
jgi:hypothetical protein